MATTVLVTKLYPPLPRLNLVSRPHLIDRLRANLYQERGFTRKLSVLSAPAGYGKTTLAAVWLQQAGYPFAWLSLDEQDNDPVRFASYLLCALRQVRPELSAAPAPGGQSPQPPSASAILTPWINAIAAAPTPFILVLDDFHVIHNKLVNQMLNFLLENMPPCMHLVVISREDPPAPLPRLRAAGQVLEIRQADLSFTQAEVQDFLCRVNGLEIPAEYLQAIASRTEGWVVGLQMVALSLQGNVDLPQFLHSFTGSHRFVMDYLIEEVFNKLPTHLQDFLLATSILDRFTAPLCDGITHRTDSVDLISHLESENVFIIPLDEVRGWYRYHHLFGDLLRQKLRQSRRLVAAELHHLAGDWFYQNGYPLDAIRHALVGEDWDQAAGWIHNEASWLLKRGELITLLDWWAKIPEAQLARYPRTALDFCWPLILSGKLAEAERLLDQASQHVDISPAELGEIAAAQAYIARSRGDDRLTVELSEKALALLPQQAGPMREILAVNLGIARWHDGQLEEAEKAMLDARRSSAGSDNRYAQLTSLIFLNRFQAARGRIRDAFQAYQPIQEIKSPIPVLALAQMDLAALQYEWNDLDACETHLAASIAIAEQTRNAEFASSAYNQLARLKFARGDAAGSAGCLQRSREMLEGQSVTPLTLARNAAAYIQLALSQGDLHEAEAWIEQAGAHADAHPFYPFLGLSAARLRLAQGQLSAAQAELEKCSALAVQFSWGYGWIAIRVLQALASRTPGGALKFLKDALTQAQPEGFLRTFIDAGQPLAPLLLEAVRRDVAAEYAARILALIQPGQAPRANLNLVEPLSQRELEVLRLVSAGCTNRQIAAQLIIGISTIKSHVHNIAGKLGADNRTQIVARARELHLI